jgi:hypothetical protein
MLDLADLLARLDRITDEIAALRAELVALLPTPAANGADTLAIDDLLDTVTASERFGYPRDTVARWCRQGLGHRVGGRWMVRAGWPLTARPKRRRARRLDRRDENPQRLLPNLVGRCLRPNAARSKGRHCNVDGDGRRCRRGPGNFG